MYQSKWCPKPDCGSPMDPHYHQGEHMMRCSKRKCLKVTPVLVSVYFHTKGIPHIATRPHVRCVHTPPSVHLCIVIVPHSSRYAPHCIAVRQATKRVVSLHIAPRRRSPCASHGGPTHIALVCVCDHHPSTCVCASRCHMRIATHQHMQSPSATLLVCSTLPHAYCCTLAHTATGSTSHRCQQLSGALTAGLYITA